jgi:predicted RNA-binding Zn ribbon-like protein
MPLQPAPGILTFRFRGGRPSVDATATVGKRGLADVERWRSAEDLSRWFVESRLCLRPVEVDRQTLVEARALREALFRLFTSVRRREPVAPGDVELANRWAAAAPGPSVTLDVDSSGRLVARERVPSASSLLAMVARDGVDLLAGPMRDRIRECERPDCTILFVDSSRAASRRWCSMDECGARSKMAAYRSRRRDP